MSTIARAAGRIEYALRLHDPHAHLLEVEVRIAGVSGALELSLPAWTPGSYLIREYARHVEDFSAEAGDGSELGWSKVAKARWRVESAAAETVRVRYRVYANELTVRTSHFDGTHAFVTPASVFMYVHGREGEEIVLHVRAPATWRVATSLRDLDGGGRRFLASGYDELVDSPLEIGRHRRLEWEQFGRPHGFVVWGGEEFDGERLISDVRRILEVVAELFGEVPYEGYLFILHLLPGGRGGLEHRSSTALQAGLDAFRGEAYGRLLALIAHEYLHVWNGKRIRPEALGPFDYERENHTRDLWVVEGLTTYYTDLVLARAGLISGEEYLRRLAGMVERLERMPGRHHQSLAESSFDAWIRFYRPDENSGNSQISYYHKGALVGLLLDLEIRAASDGERSLDDVMRRLWERYGRADVGYAEGGVEAVAAEVAGRDLAEFFERHVRGVVELEYERAFASVGLELRRGGDEAHDPAGRLEQRLGVRLREEGGRVGVAAVVRGGVGERAGVYAGDEVLAVGGERVGSIAGLAERLEGVAAGAEVELALFRRDVLERVAVEVGAAAEGRWEVRAVGEGWRRWVGGAEES